MHKYRALSSSGVLRGRPLPCVLVPCSLWQIGKSQVLYGSIVNQKSSGNHHTRAARALQLTVRVGCVGCDGKAMWEVLPHATCAFSIH
mmetsp:Transcript_1222/g.1929  ORF Transcript_1222/g.1929 Transcript_1222/m.1929 type:complete len:88 (-) Transcript_1222:30-293(-)|eukprot:scaffold300850_cov27-Tisochrysis_lutea.AAC.2